MLRDAFQLSLPLLPAATLMDADAVRAAAQHPEIDAVRDLLLTAAAADVSIPEEARGVDVLAVFSCVC